MAIKTARKETVAEILLEGDSVDDITSIFEQIKTFGSFCSEGHSFKITVHATLNDDQKEQQSNSVEELLSALGDHYGTRTKAADELQISRGLLYGWKSGRLRVSEKALSKNEDCFFLQNRAVESIVYYRCYET